MTPSDDDPVVLFDGDCSLCNGAVQFLMKRDPKGSLHYAPLQGQFAEEHLSAEERQAINTLYLVRGTNKWRRSDAVLRIVKHLRFPWNLAYGLRIIPRPIRDGLYSWVARNRTRWFGKTDYCSAKNGTIKKHLFCD